MSTPHSIALDRFGLGARPGESVGTDPRGWLADQLRLYDPAPAALATLPSREAMVTSFADYQDRQRQARQSGGESAGDEVQAITREYNRAERQTGLAMVHHRLQIAAESTSPFAERLVHFWSNHFAVSRERLRPRTLAGDYEFTAIRPHILGNFRDLVFAAVTHPAMLVFLDQARSVGPNSMVATRANRRQQDRSFGINENLARELLELHTLGVRGGYSQADVTEMARALTGWTVAGLGRGGLARFLEGTPGSAVFAEAMHEPGSRTVLGQRYSQRGAEQAQTIISDLALHPSTANHIATKLARHFIADDPPAAAIARLERAFVDSGGDLPTIYATLIVEPEVWASERNKFRTPWDWLVASLRATGIDAMPAEGQAAERLLQLLGQPVWQPGSPAGWSDITADWAAPGSLLSRVEVANRLALRMGDRHDARLLSREVLGDALRPETATAIARAEQPAFGLALFLASPEFLRR